MHLSETVITTPKNASSVDFTIARTPKKQLSAIKNYPLCYTSTSIKYNDPLLVKSVIPRILPLTDDFILISPIKTERTLEKAELKQWQDVTRESITVNKTITNLSVASDISSDYTETPCSWSLFLLK